MVDEPSRQEAQRPRKGGQVGGVKEGSMPGKQWGRGGGQQMRDFKGTGDVFPGLGAVHECSFHHYSVDWKDASVMEKRSGGRMCLLSVPPFGELSYSTPCNTSL